MNKQLLELARTQELRGNILKIAYEAMPLGAGFTLVKIVLDNLHLDFNEEEIKRAAFYLVEKDLVKIQKVENKQQGIDRDIVSITPLGIDVQDGLSEVAGITLVSD